MYTKLQQYRCGNCGNTTYNIYRENDHAQRLITECIQCKSQTEIAIKPAEIILQWGHNSNGIMCLFDE